jgi:hypothetical protein
VLVAAATVAGPEAAAGAENAGADAPRVAAIRARDSRVFFIGELLLAGSFSVVLAYNTTK